MNTYHLWFNLRHGVSDAEFPHHMQLYLDHLKAQGLLRGWRLQRRKLGFGPSDIGEWHVAIDTDDLRQLEDMFEAVARTRGPSAGDAARSDLARLHAQVYSRVEHLRTALYRDYPDQFA